MTNQAAFDFGSDVDRLIEKAGAMVASVHELAEVEKSIWGSPAGKTHLAGRLVELIPPHRVYVEPFAGGAQVLFAKEPSEIEVVSDLDPEIAFAFRFARDVTEAQLEQLRRKKWIGDKALFRKLYEAQVPDDPVERFYRFAYLVRFSFNKLRRGTMPDKNVGAQARFVERLEKFAPRLRKIRVRCADYEKVIDEHDGPDTFFFLDPPYAGYDADCRVGAGHKNWDEARFGQVLRRIKGKFLVTYGTRGDAALFKGFEVQRWRHTSGVGTSQGQGLRPGVTLVVTNFDPKATKGSVAKADEEIEKGLFRSPAGKRNVLGRLLPLIPPHKRYVEPFAGGAAVFFGKEPADEEVLNDRDADIAFAYRFIQKLTPDKLARLRRFNWTNRRDTFNAIKAKRPKNDLDRFHQFIYLNRWGYFGKGGEHATFNPAHDGETFSNLDKFEKGKERLKGVTILNDDYAKVVRRFDGPETFFFFDPPFPGYDQAVGEHEFDEPRFAEVLRSIKGKFLVTYGIRSDESVFRGFKTRRIIVPTATPKGAVKRALLLISNYEIQKSLGPDVEDVDVAVALDADDTDGFQEARALATELAEAAGRLRPRDDVSPEERAAMDELPVVARQLRDLLGGERKAAGPARDAMLVAGELGALLPGLRSAFAGDALTGARRVVDRAEEVLGRLRSGTPGPRLPAAKQEAPSEEALLELPPAPGKRDAVVQYHFRGKSVHLDLRIDIDDWLIGWTFLVQRPGSLTSPVDTVQKARALARTFSVDGDRILKPFLAPARVLATPKGRHPRQWLEINRLVIEEGEVGATVHETGVLFAVDRPSVELGLQAEDAHEYFLSGGKQVNGVLVIERTKGGDNDGTWTLSLHRSRLPRVLTRAAVEAGTMPPDGYSALPASLEDVTPPEHRYWEMSGDEARRARDALVASGLFGEDSVRLVDGEVRHVTQKLFLTLPPVQIDKALRVPFQSWGGSGQYARRLVSRLPEHERYVEPFCGSAAVLFAKEPADEEILADTNPEVIFAHQYIRDLTPASFAALKRFDWTVSRAGFEKARALEPQSDSARFWRHVYGRLCTWGAKPVMTGFSTLHEGQSYPLDDLWRFHERLRGVKILKLDWRETLERFDGPDTLFFVDPPYEDEWAHGDGIPAKETAEALRGLRSKWIVAYTASAAARQALGKVGRLFTMSFAEARHTGGLKKRPRLFASSEPLARAARQEKSDVEPSIEPLRAFEPMRPRAIETSIDKAIAEHLSPEVLAAGVAVEPAIAGERMLLHVSRAKVLIAGGARPAIEKALQALPRDVIFDAVAVGDDVFVFDVVHAGGQSLAAHPWRERQKVLARLFRKSRGCMQPVAPRVVHTAEALRDAVQWASGQPHADGAVLKLIDSPYVPGGFASSWIVVRPAAPEDSLPEEMRKLYPRYVDVDQPIVKRGTDEERFTLGIVLEPDEVDAQGDRYTAAEVRRACHRFAEFYWNAGLMHREIANGKIVILENYLAPETFTVTDAAGKKVTVKAGTWLQGRGYRDDRIWSMVKRGELTGLSMGGSAIRRPAKKKEEDAQPTA